MPEIFKHGIWFYWNDDKFELVYDSRKVDFDELISVFDDPRQVTNIDARFDYEELRFLTVGMSDKGRLLAVAWFETGDDSLTIITAFKPSKKQIRGYNND